MEEESINGLKRYMNQSQYVNLNWILIQTNYRQSVLFPSDVNEFLLPRLN